MVLGKLSFASGKHVLIYDSRVGVCISLIQNVVGKYVCPITALCDEGDNMQCLLYLGLGSLFWVQGSR